MENKFCADCKHCIFSESLTDKGPIFSYICLHPNNGKNIVTGRIEYQLCSKLRSMISMDVCGIKGLWYEVKEKKVSLFKRIRNKFFV
jgi:hypothetical protein